VASPEGEVRSGACPPEKNQGLRKREGKEHLLNLLIVNAEKKEGMREGGVRMRSFCSRALNTNTSFEQAGETVGEKGIRNLTLLFAGG